MGVLVELAGGDNTSVRLLTNALMALLNLRMDCIRERDRIDVASLLESHLSIPLPMRKDYMAGGRWPGKSYYAALANAAELVLDSTVARGYVHWRRDLHFYRHANVDTATSDPCGESASQSAFASAIESADAIGRQWMADPDNGALRQRAIDAYRASFAACATVPFQPCKGFWARNFEALTIAGVFHDVKENIENARGWFCAQLSMTEASLVERIDDEPWLIDRVIDSLYFDKSDRKRLQDDPLCRLRIENPPGKYDFTIVSCMGVITEGERGTELESTFDRLYKKRGVKVVRANTGTMRSLEFNASFVIEQIRKLKGRPFAWLGYSQGCANAYKAENMLNAGDDRDRACLEGLRGRMLLYSAANGSSHSACGDTKLLNAVIEGEKIMKHYQGVLSKGLIDTLLSGINKVFVAAELVNALGGVASLTFASADAFWRNAQHKCNVPVFAMRGIVEPGLFPEALQMLSNVLTLQMESDEHDTQVGVDDAIGYPSRVNNANARQLAASSMPLSVQRAIIGPR